MNWKWLDDDNEPLMIAIAGPNGAGKSTFFHAHLAPAGLRFINADMLARELEVDAYAAAEIADRLRRELVRQRERFVFETVFSDPVGDKLQFMKETVEAGYRVVLCFIGLDDVTLSDERVAMRVTQGGHDVPAEKLEACFPRTLANLQGAICELPRVLVFDNSDLSNPVHLIAVFESGVRTDNGELLPKWLQSLL